MKIHGQRIDFLAGGTTGYPHSEGEVAVSVLHVGGKKFGFEGLKGFLVPKKTSDVNQDIGKERFDLLGMALEIFRILCQVVRLGEEHSASDPALNRAVFIVTV